MPLTFSCDCMLGFWRRILTKYRIKIVKSLISPYLLLTCLFLFRQNVDTLFEFFAYLSVIIFIWCLTLTYEYDT